MTIGPTRLTQLAACAGCAAKAGAEQLACVVSYLAERQHAPDPNLLVGLVAPDDAAVYRLNPKQAIVVSVDFFAPLVDDPYSYGAIAAANALSDIYAMGSEAVLAFNIAAFPAEMDLPLISEILRGGADKIEEAGAVVAGGHTIIDAEPKYGYCVVGLVHPDHVLTKSGARPGDLLYLTKPLGTGLITTAAKFEEAHPDHLATAIQSMTALNRHPAHIVRDVGAHALTDITGYGILGHAHEIAAASRVSLQIEACRLPVLPGALDYAYRGNITGGALRNEEYLKGKVSISPEISAEMRHVLNDPQTSGGLLFAVAAAKAAEAEERFGAAELPLWQIGMAIDGYGVRVV